MTTEYGPSTIWLIIIVGGLGTFALRLSFILLLGRLGSVPPKLAGLLRFVPAGVLAALVVPAIIALSLDPGIGLVAEPPKVIAGAIAAVIAWRTESVFATIAVGMSVLWIVQFLL